MDMKGYARIYKGINTYTREYMDVKGGIAVDNREFMYIQGNLKR
jgi:hypothetical protein